ncbi:MAG: orotidine-5'-phosphate decarboxylase [Gammaproteobacteria bacterium]|nr:MAG: orotidine-5'-phosphate decarboxylase [Gammaproteobacteria bacterium]
MNSPIIIPLDLEYDKAIKLAELFDPKSCRLKVGSQLFTSSGPRIIKDLQSLGFDIFLDLKFHDIPNTVSQAVKVAADLGVWMVNVHVSGGSSMLESARNALSSYRNPPLLIGVTMLTSLSNEDVKEIGIPDISEKVMQLALLAKSNGLDGIVCSPREVKVIKELCGKEFIAVTPGIRTKKMNDDQSRVSSPKEAINNGSDFLVIGRPIIESSNPLKSLNQILDDIEL